MSGLWVDELWTEVLGLPATDDLHFFDGGGHSLLAARMIAGVSRAAGVRVPLSLVFENPRLGDFKRALDQLVSAGSSAE